MIIPGRTSAPQNARTKMSRLPRGLRASPQARGGANEALDETTDVSSADRIPDDET